MNKYDKVQRKACDTDGIEIKRTSKNNRFSNFP